jgi:hypothetical protein
MEGPEKEFRASQDGKTQTERPGARVFFWISNLFFVLTFFSDIQA